ncbi:MAG TPA: STAS domain-containing protein [Actinomycetota bacterium]|jgi:stage II sporulation protein AA (anti-sigma F factor antagonist)|nr:STAS domain-containing protein [Actinomycetota bacterium]
MTLEGDGEVLTARITGEIDLSNASELEETIVDAVQNTALGMVVDLSGVEYLDSAGVRMLVHLVERFRWRQQVMRAAAPDGSRVRGVLSMAGADGVIPVDATVTDAREWIVAAADEAANREEPGA